MFRQQYKILLRTCNGMRMLKSVRLHVVIAAEVIEFGWREQEWRLLCYGIVDTCVARIAWACVFLLIAGMALFIVQTCSYVCSRVARAGWCVKYIDTRQVLSLLHSLHCAVVVLCFLTPGTG